MHRALFLTILMLAAPLVALSTNFEMTDEYVVLDEGDEALNSAKVATNPLGWEWVAKDTDAGFVWTRSVETDSSQSSYISGIFRGGSLSIDNQHALNEGGLDAFVAKFDTSGNVLWLTSFGGVLDEYVEDMLVDDSGNVVVVGSYDSPQFNASTDVLTNSGSRDGFAIQINANNGSIDWGNSINGAGFDNITGVTKDSHGHFAYSGWTASPTLTVNGTVLNNSGDTDFLILWGLANGTWDQGRIYGGTGKEQAHDIVADQNGKVMVAAEFSTPSLTLDQTTISHGGGSGSDSLVMRVAHAGVEWVRKPICNVNDRAWKLDVDSAGNVFVVGELMANTSSSHSITWGSIQINNGRDYESVYVVKFSNVGAIGWALETQNNYYRYHSPSIDVFGSKILVGLTANYYFYFRGSSSSSQIYIQTGGYDNAIVVELTNTGSTVSYSNYCIRSGRATIDDVAWMDIGSAYPDVVASINHQARQDYDYNVYSDAPATTVSRFSWSNGQPQSYRFYKMIGHTGTEDIIDLEPLNSTATVMMGVTNAFSHSLRFGNDVLGGNASIADQSTTSTQSRLFLAVASDNGTWTDVAQIKMGARMSTSTSSYTNEKDFAAMAIGPNGTVWVGFHWNGWVDIPGLTSRNSGSGFIVASWSPTSGWMSADTIGFSTSQYVNLDIAVDVNGDVFFSGACAGTTTIHGTQFSGSNYWNICIAQRHGATSSWINLHRSGNSNTATMEAMTDHPSGGVVFWAKSGYFTNPSGGTSYPGSYPGALIRLIPSNSTMWWMGAPTCSSSNCIYIESIDTTPTGDVYIAGHFQNSVSFPNCCSVNSGGSRDGFIAKFNNTGVWDWSIALGGTSNDYIYDINMVGNGSVVVVGKKTGVISVGLTTLSSAGTGFVAMASTLGTWEWAAQPSGSTTVKQVTATGNGTVAAAGQLHYSTSARTFGLDSLNSSDGDDIFLARMSADADADGITDNRDNCQQIYNPSQTNYDGDNQGDICDADDDAEGIADSVDSCPMGALGWTSNNTTDHDTDGCKDDIEDSDDDNDGLLDSNDACMAGTLNWTSNSTTDYDTDGCKDSNEDLDDDDDSVNDTADACPKGSLGWISTSSTDHDGDGCKDSNEDLDDDNDGIGDDSDTCIRGELNWTSSNVTDNDGDGCLDATEDLNDDNDHYQDYDDSCPNGTVGWYSGSITDYDGDGCKDSDEDLDDDADGILDIDDNCPRGVKGWVTNPTVDFDADGCHDWNEDTDDDGDGVSDLIDDCSRTMVGEAPNADGCAPGEIPDGNGGGGSSSVNYTEDNTYVNNTYVNNTYVNNTYANNSYDNETFQNQTFQNQTFQNNTNLNQTINEGDILNDTADNTVTDSVADEESLAGMSWVPLIVVILMVLLLFIQALQLVKKPMVPSGPPESMLAEQSVFDEIDYSSDVLESSNDFIAAEDEVKESIVETPQPVVAEAISPPMNPENPTISDGFEWIEWPEGSGKNYFRTEDTQDDWIPWPIE